MSAPTITYTDNGVGLVYLYAAPINTHTLTGTLDGQEFSIFKSDDGSISIDRQFEETIFLDPNEVRAIVTFARHLGIEPFTEVQS